MDEFGGTAVPLDQDAPRNDSRIESEHGTIRFQEERS